MRGQGRVYLRGTTWWISYSKRGHEFRESAHTTDEGKADKFLSRRLKERIAWLSNSLSTLRRTGYPAATQDSLPAAGQALPDGLFTRRIPMKGFRFASLHLIPLSQALLGTMFTTYAR